MKIDILCIFSFDMIKLAYKISLLLVPVFALLAYIEIRLFSMPNSYNYKRACFEKQLGTTEILILGNSQAYFAVNPDYLEKEAFNLSCVSQTLDYDIALTHKYIPSLPKLRYVLIHLSYTTLGYTFENSSEAWREYYYHQFWDVKTTKNNALDLRLHSKVALYTPRVALRYFFNDFQADLTSNINYNGYFFVDSAECTPSINAQSGTERALGHTKLISNEVIKRNTQLLTNFIQSLINNNIIPVFFTTPTYITYRSSVSPSVLKNNNAIIQELCRTYRLKYYNYFEDPRFVITDFKDNDHLNFIGAQKFSFILNNNIRNDFKYEKK